MNFRQIATEIMLTANEEKWYETRDRIEKALRAAHACAPGDRWIYVPEGYDAAQFFRSTEYWRDQPDGVR